MSASSPTGVQAGRGDPVGSIERRPGPNGGQRPQFRTLIIGYGSPIRGDDALGPLAADLLDQRLSARAGASTHIEVFARHILTAELVDDLIRAQRVVFIDAAADSPPGQINLRRLTPNASALSTMAHFHDPRELLAWCGALYQRAPEAWLFSVGGGQWGYASYTLSGAAQDAIEPLIAQVLALIEQPLTATHG